MTIYQHINLLSFFSYIYISLKLLLWSLLILVMNKHLCHLASLNSVFMQTSDKVSSSFCTKFKTYLITHILAISMVTLFSFSSGWMSPHFQMYTVLLSLLLIRFVNSIEPREERQKHITEEVDAVHLSVRTNLQTSTCRPLTTLEIVII